MKQDLAKMPAEQVKAIIGARLKDLLNLDEASASQRAENIYEHYEKLKIFPKSEATLDASVRVMAGFFSKETPPNTPW